MVKRKKHKDQINYYIHREMADALDRILAEVGNKHNIRSRSELIGRVLSSFIGYYESDSYSRAKLATAKLGEDLKES